MKTITFLSILCCALTFMSCGDDDPVTGCMDSNATNFNPDATEDSGNCTYAAGCTDEDADNYDENSGQDDGSCTYFDRFVGTYDGVFVCDGLLNGLLDMADSEITKNSIADNQDSITVRVSNPATVLTLLLQGSITKDEAVIDTYIENFEYTLDTPIGIIEGPFDVYVDGTLTRSSDGTITGPVTIRIDQLSSAVSLTDVCTYTATPK